MFFVIAGMQPKTRTIDSVPQRCPQCGLHQAYTQQVDHYFSLFFIPLLKVKTGEPFLYCRRCQTPVGSGGTDYGGPAEPMCRQCGRTVQSGFQYCPHCGKRR